MPQRSPRRFIIAILLALALEGIAFSLSAATNAPFLLTARRADGGDLWQLSWQTQPGIQYTLQKSADLARWVDVVTVLAESNSVTQLASAIPSETKTFWRVVTFPNGRAKGDSEPLTVSPVIASYQLSGAASRALLRIVTGGTQAVNNVMFFDNGIVLGNALPGFGNTWTFNLVWDGATPQTRQVSATVTTEEGTTNETPVSAFLLADPSRFVPVKADSTRAYGEFVSVDTAGNLGAFLFYPEGLGDAAMVTGAYFEFSAGASLRTQGGVNEIEFSNGAFFRGHQDTTPIVASAGTHRINIDAATPAAVAAAMGLPGNSVQLLWGSVPLDWLSGALSDRGWAGLIVRPPIGNFPLPNGQECALVSFDPKSSDPTLIVCYHGDWAPFDGGPQFRIPRSEPLKIYLSLSGKIAAHGTVETMFANGATVRGSVSWREPNFEVRLQGRNITIPALTSLKRALPANPGQVIPAGNTTAELDSTAQALASFRDTYRSLAMGGLAESSTAGTETLAPLGQPADPSGTALQAWASRLASWSADRAGQVLDTEQVADLRKVIENAGKTGEAAHDLPTVLKLLRDVLVASKFLDLAVSASESEILRTQLNDAQARLFAAAERVIDGSKGFEASTSLSEIVELLGGAAEAETLPQSARLPRVKAGESSAVRRVTAQIKRKLGSALIKEIQDAAVNVGLTGKSTEDLLLLLRNLSEYLTLALIDGEVPPGHPTVAQVHRAALNARTHFALRNNEETAEALRSQDYARLRNVLAARARFYQWNDKLDALVRPAGLSSLRLHSRDGTFAIQTFVLVETFVLRFTELQASGGGLNACQADMEFFSLIAEHTTDDGVGALVEKGKLLMDTCAAVKKETAAPTSTLVRCDELRQTLLQPQNRFVWGNRNPAEEGAKFPDITGMYESVENEGGRKSFVTLQLNQGGRYLEGALQLKVESGGAVIEHRDFRATGLFMRQTEIVGVMEFGLQLEGPATLLFKGFSTNKGGTALPTISLKSVSTGEIIELYRVSSSGVLSEALIEAFDPSEHNVIKASQKSPLHTLKAKETEESAATIIPFIDDYYDAADRDRELLAVNRLQDRIRGIGNRVTPDQRPLTTDLIRQVLTARPPRTVSTSDLPGEHDTEEKTMRYWDLLLAITIRENLNLSAELGLTPAQLEQLQQTIGKNDFRYELTVRQKSAAGDIAPFISFGAGDLDVTVKKFSGDVLLADFDLHGYINIGGPSAGHAVSCSVTENVFTFHSALDLQPHHFVGNVTYTSAGVSGAVTIPQLILDPRAFIIWQNLLIIKAIAGVDQSVNNWQVGYFTVHGSGAFAPMTFYTRVTEGLSENDCSSEGIGIEHGRGHIRESFPGINVSYLLPQNAPPIPSDVPTRPHLRSGVYFETDGTNLTECGWQFLREFVAENHEVFVQPKADILIEGHADAAGRGQYNSVLSTNRAAVVGQALRGLIDPRHQPVFRIIGKGEEEHDRFLGIAADIIPADPDVAAQLNNPLFRRADIIIGGVVKASMLRAPPTPEQ